LTVWLFCSKYELLSTELASIYHFYLHPEHLPTGDTASSSSSARTSRGGGNDYAPVHISLKIGWTEKRKALVDIADLRDSEMDIFGRYIQEGKKPFPFTVHFPDPEDLTKRDSFDAQQSVCFHLIVAFIVMWLNVLTLLCRGLVRLRSMRCEEFCSIFLLMEVGLCTFLLRELAFKSSFNV
jgi:hypothetical protein